MRLATGVSVVEYSCEEAADYGGDLPARRGGGERGGGVGVCDLVPPSVAGGTTRRRARRSGVVEGARPGGN